MDNKEYLELILRKEELEKEAINIYNNYISIYGDLLIKRYELNIDVIRIRKMISFCAKKNNYGESIKKDELDKYITDVMKSYDNELEKLKIEKEQVDNLEKIDYATCKMCKDLYYKIAKKCHPDMMNNLDNKKEEIFIKAKDAYRKYDIDTLKLLYDEVKLLNDLDNDIDDLEYKIDKITKEINDIIENNPYVLKYEYTPESIIEIKKKELNQEIDSIKKTINELNKKLKEFNIEGDYN